MSEEITSKEIMRNSVQFIQDGTDQYKLNNTLKAINVSYGNRESGLVIGQCKAMVESLCKSILKENHIKIEKTIKIGKLAKKAASTLNANGGYKLEKKTREAFTKLISSFTISLENASSSIGSLRNEYCPVAHGRSTDHQPLHLLYAQFVASQTDAFVAFLLNLIVHKSVFAAEITPTKKSDFDEYLAEEFGELKIYGDIYLASEILFQMNKPEYDKVFTEYFKGERNDK